MQIVRTREELAAARLALPGELAFVPTMGALHPGHMALIEAGKKLADNVAASIFVNPTQFGPDEDYGRYPRQEKQDAEMLEDAGCSLLWLPAVSDIYPKGFATSVRVRGISDRWEGQARPGHFDGVATVVARLLMTVQPSLALFGEKDYQQLAVIRRMVTDLNLPVKVVGVPTVRDRDGLALSSRNAYLSSDQRDAAVALPRSLESARSAILRGEDVGRTLEDARASLSSAGFERIDYVALVDATTLEPVEAPTGATRLIAAAVIGTTRLIDNIAV